jgi:glycosyltransferase involved in cell wall biosynthesis
MIRDAGPIRVLQFLPVFAIGGTERQVVNLSAGLDRTRFDLHIGCFERRGEFLPEIEARQIPVTEYKINRLYGPHTMRQQFKLAGYLRRQRIDVVHSYNFYANCFAVPAARLAGVPVIVAAIRDTGAFLPAPHRTAHRLICRLAHVVLANAAVVRDWLIGEGYPPEAVQVIRNGIDLTRFAARPRVGGGVRAELGIPQDAPVVAMLARVNRLKGVEYFVEAAAGVAASFPDARFLVIGDALLMTDGVVGPNADYRRELDDRIRGLGLEGRVIFTGFRLDVPELLGDVTVAVHPSLSEALSNAVLESMAAGIPVVATHVGGTPEIIEDGVTGLLVPPRDSAALAHAVCRILQDRDLAARVGHAGRRRIVEHFSLARMVGETERLYVDRLAQTRRGRARGRLPDPGVVQTYAEASPGQGTPGSIGTIPNE